ncbi:MAG: Glutamate 5-kinase [Chthonomonadales bacterium]|nr:Glutamate 5-kinase [Chthonomonadales bacterium]
MSVERLVVKVGTSTLTDPQGKIDRAFIADLTIQLAALRAQGCEVILVTSGAIRAGREALAARGNGEVRSGKTAETLPYKQAAAAIGQGRLMHTYTEAFAWRNVDCAQVLLTRDDLDDRRRFLNARNTLLALLDMGIVPVINENDTVAVDEIKFGDNDALAALVATLVEADLLLILSDVEGLYAHPPVLGAPPPELIRTVTRVDETLTALAGTSTSGVGTGGMRTKLEAARIATAAGIRTVIARGRRERVVSEVVSGELIGTTFLPLPNSDRLPARKRWIAHGARARGSVTVNARAKERLLSHGVSLLAAGIVDVSGAFHVGDLIQICVEGGSVFGRGLTNYAASEVRRVVGLHSEQFEAILGYRGSEEIIHRDNLVIDSPSSL